MRQWTDGEGDMWYDKNRPAPEEVTADIRHVSVDHKRRKLVINVRYTDLDEDDSSSSLWGTIRTNEGKWRWFNASYYNGEAESEVWEAGRNCVSSALFDHEANTVKLRIRRSCLSQPRWVRVYIASTGSHYVGRDNILHYRDDAMNDQAPYPDRETFTRRIYRA
jgi:hypothetical protein